MTIQQFSILEDIEQVNAIMQYGRLLAQSHENNRRVFLYQLETFYVSATYKADDQLQEIRCFEEVKQSVPHFRKSFILVHPAGRSL